MYIEFIILPIVGALIGWITNYLAVKMLFRPLKPVKIPLLPFEVQGLLPRRKSQLADSIARAVEQELLPRDYLLSKISELQIEVEILNYVKELLDKKLDEKMPAFIPQVVRGSIKDFVIKFTEEELAKNLDKVIYELQEKVIDQANLGQLVKEKIESFPLPKLEEMVLDISARELRHIELFGGILGFLVGLAQATLLLLIDLYA